MSENFLAAFRPELSLTDSPLCHTRVRVNRRRCLRTRTLGHPNRQEDRESGRGKTLRDLMR